MDKYIGHWRDDKRHGEGTYLFKNGDNFQGIWNEDAWNGNGIFSYENGDYYVGSIINKEKHGEGVYTYKNGDSYTGEYVNDKRGNKYVSEQSRRDARKLNRLISIKALNEFNIKKNLAFEELYKLNDKKN